MRPVDVAAAWLAGIRHVLACKDGCPICKVPDDFAEKQLQKEAAATVALAQDDEKPDDEKPLDEAVKRKYDSPFKNPWGGGPK